MSATTNAAVRGTRSVSFRTRLWLLLAAGLVVRLWLAFKTKGLVFDLQSYALVERALLAHPLHVYTLVNPPALLRWPYPSGYFPVILLIHAAGALFGLAFTSLIRLPAILGDCAIAWVVQDFLGWRGASERIRLTAAASVAAGPLFIAVSGYNGQFDSVAILPAVIAIALWDRMPPGRRALLCGALIGLGGLLKWVPLLMVVALLPSCRSRREGITLIVAAVAVLAIGMAPFVAADAHAALQPLSWRGLAGLGGLSLVAQPDLASFWIAAPVAHMTGITHALQGSLGTVVLALGLCAAALAVLRFRPRGADAASLLWVTAFVLSVNFGPRYGVWGLPFLLMARHVGKALVLQAALAVPEILFLAGPYRHHSLTYVYSALMLAVWVLCLAGAAFLARRLTQHGGPRLARALS